MMCASNSPAWGQTMVISYWDFWMAVVLIEDYAGDWDRLVARLRHDLSGLSFRHYAAEGVLNHLIHLRQSLQESGLTAYDILAAADPANIKKQKAKARQQILVATPSDREKSYWMLHTPRAGTRDARPAWLLGSVSGISCPLRGGDGTPLQDVGLLRRARVVESGEAVIELHPAQCVECVPSKIAGTLPRLSDRCR